MDVKLLSKLYKATSDQHPFSSTFPVRSQYQHEEALTPIPIYTQLLYHMKEVSFL